MIFKPEAAQDVLDAVAWYESQRQGTGARFSKSLDKAFQRIKLMPEAPRILSRNVRRVLMTGFPFAVYYHIDEGEIVVLAVIHSRRDPRLWKSRV